MEKNNTNKGIKIVITGPESTGKSSLSESLAAHFDTPWIPEYAREYLIKLNRPYEEKDLAEIASGQFKKEQSILKPKQITFLDTSFEVIKIWSEWKYDRCATKIENLFKNQKPSLYLLTSPDLPWQEDELRENPNDRQQLFEIYKELLQSTGIQFRIIDGQYGDRESKAISAVQAFLNLHK